MGWLMRKSRRWRKTPNNVLTIDASLIRSIVCDNIDFAVPTSLYDYMYEVDDDTLNWLGEQIINDPDLWLAITDAVNSYALSLKFQEVLDQGGMENE